MVTPFLDIDGSARSGSGTLLRQGVVLAALLGTPVHIFNIRAKRPNPGLRPQHLKAAQACATLCGGELKGGRVGSMEIHFIPGGSISPGRFFMDIGTAGSATMLAMVLIPLGLFSHGPCEFHIRGGLFQDNAPTYFHMKHVLIPMLRRMGAWVEADMIRPGYVPKGGGEMVLKTRPLSGPLDALVLPRQGEVLYVSGVSIASHLKRRSVAQRMAERCREALKRKGLEAQIRTMEDESAPQPGAALAIWAETSEGCLLGADQAGKPGRSSESIADSVAGSLLDDLSTEATVDRYLADQLIPMAALAAGTTHYRLPRWTDHVDANLWIAERMAGARSQMKANVLQIEGIGLEPKVPH
jgi:RNA 3'-terminal phosphate cyclase (ATP)